MSNLIPFAQSGNQLPAHIGAFMEGEESNIAPKSTIPQLSFRGKVWRMAVDGEEKTVTGTDGEPRTVVKVVILNQNPNRSRSYYEGAYEEGKSQAPACWSGDGKTPDADVKEPQAKACASCPQSVKGSKITEAGKDVTACAQFKRLAVVPYPGITNTPLLLRLPQTSLWDKDNAENEGKGWYAYDQYLDMLRARGCTHTATVVTKVKFDHRKAYPKLLFAAEGWLAPDELLTLKEIWNGGDVKKLLTANEEAASGHAAAPAVSTPAPTPAAAVVDDDDEEAPPPVAPPKKAKAKSAPAAVVVSDDGDDGDDDDDDDGDEEAPPPVTPPKKAKAKPAPAAVVVSDDGDDDVPPAPAPTAPPATPASKGLGALLDGWDD